MAQKFDFRLQRVLELRERKEQEQARKLSAAQHAAETAETARDEMARERDRAADGLRDAAGRTAGELRAMSMVLAHMDRHVDAAAAAAAAAAKDVDAAQGRLNEAFKERRVLDRLKERAHEAWQTEMVQQDRQLMDSIALSRFGKRTPTTTDSVE